VKAALTQRTICDHTFRFEHACSRCNSRTRFDEHGQQEHWANRFRAIAGLVRELYGAGDPETASRQELEGVDAIKGYSSGVQNKKCADPQIVAKAQLILPAYEKSVERVCGRDVEEIAARSSDGVGLPVSKVQNCETCGLAEYSKVEDRGDVLTRS
jgi:hypothetical protein